ncbi:hypothetical protein M0R45_028682 [Rubus argutus]|uniref:Uncharacterized protein n=1 Tax=Rubus argutus TaxID=59490 RepID=A0AAW1W837_RUBAR
MDSKNGESKAVLGEAKVVGDGPTAENGGDRLRFKRIRVELAWVAPIGAISHGWAEWVPGSIGWADLGLIVAFNGGNVERSRQLGKRIDAGGENRGQIGDAGRIGGAARVCRGGTAESSACTEEARMIGLHSGVGNFSKGAMGVTL